jgi:hypothetical protein
MAKALATIGTGAHSIVLRMSRPTFEAYADTHGYTYVEGDEAAAQGRPGAWGKVKLIDRLLAQHEIVVWIDADACIVKLDADIASELPADKFQGIANTSTVPAPNTGVWVLRSDERSAKFLAEVWDGTHRVTHNFWEQAAVLDLLGFDESQRWAHVKQTPWFEGTHWLGEEWNTIPRVCNDFESARIIHIANRDRFTRVARIAQHRRVRTAPLLAGRAFVYRNAMRLRHPRRDIWS